MAEPFVGEIRMFAGTFAPRGWALCDGQLLAISQNDALFSLFGTIYGGDGRTTFGLPELRGRLPIHFGSGPGLTSRSIGSKSGAETETISAATLTAHSHTYQASTDIADESDPSANVLAQPAAASTYFPGVPTVGLAGTAVESVGGSQSHANLMPFLCVNFIVALTGIYPSRT
ncbi:MAG: tail fiber protein [Actinomycetota bacterium]|nr:tail fiber protein [Actinomycetota bacterium]